MKQLSQYPEWKELELIEGMSFKSVSKNLQSLISTLVLEILRPPPVNPGIAGG